MNAAELVSYHRFLRSVAIDLINHHVVRISGGGPLVVELPPERAAWLGSADNSDAICRLWYSGASSELHLGCKHGGYLLTQDIDTCVLLSLLATLEEMEVQPEKTHVET